MSEVLPHAARGTDRPSRTEWAALAVVVLTALAPHLAAIGGPFFADDYLFLEQVRGRGFFSALASPDPLGNFVRPVSRAAWFWLCSRAGESPVVFHAANLAAFAAVLVLFHRFVRGWLGAAPALAATAFVAFHHAFDVPLRWASGSQDLLALGFALAALALHRRGSAALAAPALLAGLFSKESVAATALIAVLADRFAGLPWRRALTRALPLAAATLVWAAVWLRVKSASGGAGSVAAFGASDALASLARLPQVAAGLEWRAGGSPFGHVSLAIVPVVAIAAGVVALAGRAHPPSHAGADAPPSVRPAALAGLGTIWALSSALVLAPVASIWSAYLYGWSLLGVALIVGAAAAAVPPRWRLAMVATLAATSAATRGLDEFAPVRDAWSATSHVNRHYVERAQHTIEQYLREMKQSRPALPPRATVFFANVPVASGWQAADGPLLRWAYRDTSVRSYFLGEFTAERASRGPAFFYAIEDGRLVDKTADPAMAWSLAFSPLLADRPAGVIEAAQVLERTRPLDDRLRYWRAWARRALGDTAGAHADLRACGFEPGARPASEAERAAVLAIADPQVRLGALEALRARHAADPWVHARMSALLLQAGRDDDAAAEAYAYRVLAPADPDAWRKWAAAQIAKDQFEAAAVSLERYLELAGADGHSDDEARRTLESLRSMVRGDLAREALRTAR